MIPVALSFCSAETIGTVVYNGVPPYPQLPYPECLSQFLLRVGGRRARVVLHQRHEAVKVDRSLA